MLNISLQEKEETVILRGKNGEAQKTRHNDAMRIPFNFSFLWGW